MSERGRKLSDRIRVLTPDEKHDLFNLLIGYTPDGVSDCLEIIEERRDREAEPNSEDKPIGYCANCFEQCEGKHGPCFEEVIGCTECFRPDDVDNAPPQAAVDLMAALKESLDKAKARREATFNPAYQVTRCGDLSTHGPHVVDHGPDRPRNCPGTGQTVTAPYQSEVHRG